MLARVIGSDKFRPLVPDCVRLGLGLLESVDDPDIRRCTLVRLYLGFMITIKTVHRFIFFFWVLSDMGFLHLFPPL